MGRPFFPGVAWGLIADEVTIHAFGDASTLGYAAVVYLRISNTLAKYPTNSPYVVSFGSARARVAPLKPMSLPRLELMGALVAARLGHYVSMQLGLHPSCITAYSDSTISLNWIKGDPLRFKAFVANRVAEIQELIPPSQ